ncbi:MAG: nuclear transport factor 2 family protein [Thermodesulfobacteriota bacterium]
MDLEELEKQVTLMEDIQEIENLQRIYAYYFDSHQWQNVVDLFSENVESVEIADYGVYKGKKGVKRFYLDLLRGKPPRVGELSIGMIMQGVVNVDPNGKTAKGRWYCIMIEAKPTLSLHEGELRQLWGNGIFENEYVKENGKWLFKKVFFFLNFRTPYEDGWLKVPVVGQNGPSTEVPPDAPPTFYHPYPAGVHLQPHYKHPITGK